MGHVLRPEEHLHPSLAAGRLPPALGRATGSQRELDRTQPHALGRGLPHHQVRRAEEGGHELRLGAQVELVRRAGFQEAPEAQHGQTVRQLERLLAAGGDDGRESDRTRLAGLQVELRANGYDRVQHRARRSRERSALVEGDRVARRAPAPDELRAVGFAGRRTHVVLSPVGDMHAPQRALLRGPRPTRGRDRGTPLVPLGLDEQVGKGRMRAVGLGRSEDDLAIARDFDVARYIAGVGDRHVERDRGDADGRHAAGAGHLDVDRPAGAEAAGTPPGPM